MTRTPNRQMYDRYNAVITNRVKHNHLIDEATESQTVFYRIVPEFRSSLRVKHLRYELSYPQCPMAFLNGRHDIYSVPQWEVDAYLVYLDNFVPEPIMQERTTGPEFTHYEEAVLFIKSMTGKYQPTDFDKDGNPV